MTAKRFELIWETDEMCNVFDNDLDVNSTISVEDVVDLLNELHEENQELRLQLNLCSDQRNEFHRGARENANRVGKLEKENEQLKKQIEELKVDLKMAKIDGAIDRMAQRPIRW